MAIIWFDGFERYATGSISTTPQYYSTATNGNIAVAGRYDGQCIQISTNQTGVSGIARTLSPSVTSISVGVALYLSATYTTVSNTILLMSGTAAVIAINITPSVLSIVNNGVTTTIPFPKVYNVITTWNYVEIEAITSLTSGMINFYWNGELLYSTSGVPVKTTTNLIAIDSVSLRSPGTFNGPSWWYDDFYITNTSTRLGEIHIAGLKPTGDTTQKQWTPSTGTANYAMVNDLLKTTDTTWVQTLNSGDKDYYDIQDMSSSVISGQVLAVGIYGIGNKSTFGPASVALAAKSGTTETFGTPQVLYENTNIIIPSITMETDPATNAAWTTAGVNNLQIGIRSS